MLETYEKRIQTLKKILLDSIKVRHSAFEAYIFPYNVLSRLLIDYMNLSLFIDVVTKVYMK